MKFSQTFFFPRLSAIKKRESATEYCFIIVICENVKICHWVISKTLVNTLVCKCEKSFRRQVNITVKLISLHFLLPKIQELKQNSESSKKTSEITLLEETSRSKKRMIQHWCQQQIVKFLLWRNLHILVDGLEWPTFKN